MCTKELAQSMHPFELREEIPSKDRLGQAINRLGFVGEALWVYSLAFDGDAEGSTMFSPSFFARVLAEINREAVVILINLEDDIRFEVSPSGNGQT